jgi:hypothetical protein
MTHRIIYSLQFELEPLPKGGDSGRLAVVVYIFA